jgi:adenosylmethionine-8-amino-7-oxononanoate aminotransferase
VAPFPDPLASDQDREVDAALAALAHLLKTMTAPEETAAMVLEPVLGGSDAESDLGRVR